MELSSSLPVRPIKSVPPCRKVGNGLEAVFKLRHYPRVPPAGTSDMIRAILPFRLRTVAHADREVTLEVEGPGYLGRPKNKT
jgi:hypothetical protein